MDTFTVLEIAGSGLAMIVFTAIMLTLFVRWSKKDRPSSWK